MKKGLLLIGALAIVFATVPMFAAFEAHVINVTAHIENALKVIPPEELVFGTVFPQEYLTKNLFVTTSESFCNAGQRRVLNIDYKIVQKPKPIWPEPTACGQQFADEAAARTYCHANPSDMDCCYPSLCPYLSKDPVDNDAAPYTDYGVPAFHDPNATSSVAIGTINKDNDLQDQWLIDLAVPCFSGHCAQDWADFVHQYNPNADPADYILPYSLESATFGCDLWIEVTRIY